MRNGSTTSAVVVLLALGGVAASAQSKSRLGCGGNNFATCASVRVSVSGTLVTVFASNLSGPQGAYGGALFGGLGPNSVPQNVCLVGSNGGSNTLWKNPTCGTTGVTNSTPNGRPIAFSLPVNQSWNLSTTQVLVNGQTRAGGQSNQGQTGAGGQSNQGQTGAGGQSNQGQTGAGGQSNQGQTGAGGQSNQGQTGAGRQANQGQTECGGQSNQGHTGAVGQSNQGQTGAVGQSNQGQTGAGGQSNQGQTGAGGQSNQGQ